jgi:flagellar biosynthetic protein FlhB
MSDAPEQDRSELPTRYKLERARRHGSVARGADLGFLVSLAAFCVYFWFQGDALIASVVVASRNALVTAPQLAGGSDQPIHLMGQVLQVMLRPVGFLMASVFVSVLVMELVQTGFVFSSEPLRPDFSRLNPAAGFKRVFSARMMIEAAKNVVKLAVYSGVAVLLVRYVLDEVAGAVIDAAGLAEALRRLTLRLLVIVLAIAALFAVVDQFIVRRDFTQRMRMSRRELKREHRDREGDPRLKQRRRHLHAEFVKLSKSLKGVRGADVLITNPTHYAVALKYDSRTMVSPKVVSRGANHVAQRLRRLAFLYGVVIVQNPPLARALYAVPLDKETPEALFKPVADIYLAIREAKQRDIEARTHAA